MIKVNLSTLNDIKNELVNKVKTSFISNITLVNNCDLIFSFSHYREEKLFVSLNHQSPFLSLIKIEESIHTLTNNLNDVLRKEIKDSKIIDIELINNDRILKFTLSKISETFDKEIKYLIFEFVPHKPNLIILNKDEIVIFATHYTDINKERIVKQKFKYEAPINNLNNNEPSIELEKLKLCASNYLKESKLIRQKEKNKELFTFVNRRLKILTNKIKNLQLDIEKANEKLIYKEYGDMCYLYAYDEESLHRDIQNGVIKDYDLSLTPIDNANRYFKIYKKAKTTLALAKEEINKAYQDIEYFNHIKIQIENAGDDDINEIKNIFFPAKDKKKKLSFSKSSPYFINYKSTRIAFGKTDIQNNELTFNKANPNYHFFHVKNIPGAHVVIFSDNPSNDEKLIASEICLILSKLSSGEVDTTQIKNVRKGTKIGQVFLKKETSIYLRGIRQETIELLETAKRM